MWHKVRVDEPELFDRFVRINSVLYSMADASERWRLWMLRTNPECAIYEGRGFELSLGLEPRPAPQPWQGVIAGISGFVDVPEATRIFIAKLRSMLDSSTNDLIQARFAREPIACRGSLVLFGCMAEANKLPGVEISRFRDGPRYALWRMRLRSAS